jgi:beta-lactamase superfamily II metal-dependent hydrolase
MPAPAITLEVLPAHYGDCLLVTCPVGRRPWRMLIDTGPDETFPRLKARLQQIPAAAGGQRHIDLLIISHIDHDHIGGAALLLADRSLGLTFGDVWFNTRPRARGVAEGVVFTQALNTAGASIAWNQAFGGKSAVTAGIGAYTTIAGEPRAPAITLLSPAPEQLATLYKVWDREVAKLHAREHDPAEPPAPRSREAGPPDWAALAARKTLLDRAPANGSSITILLEHQGASVLLGADAIPEVLVPALQALARDRGVTGGMRVDAFKLSHHGSRANVTHALLAAVRADHYLFSTNGAIFGHPDDEAVARVIVHGGRESTLWFNYANERNLRWGTAPWVASHGCRIEYPQAEGAGLTLKLAARRG